MPQHKELAPGLTVEEFLRLIQAAAEPHSIPWWTMTDCLFCKIANHTIPVKAVFEDDAAIAFPDINPQAPTHVLLIPKQHYANVTEVPVELLGHLLEEAAALAKRALPGGHRIVVNTGDDGGQTVHHVHLHILGGRRMAWPPG